MTMKKPRSPYDKVSGAYYFARMLDKMRLNAAGSLHGDYHGNLGRGFDGRLCRFLRVGYPELVQQVLAGKSDDEAWAWCLEHGRQLSEEDVVVWNGFVSTRGWRDAASSALEDYKRQSGLSHRDDLLTYFEYYEVDEGRRP
jgi:Domain of unknown function (DUF5069)